MTRAVVDASPGCTLSSIQDITHLGSDDMDPYLKPTPRDFRPPCIGCQQTLSAFQIWWIRRYDSFPESNFFFIQHLDYKIGGGNGICLWKDYVTSALYYHYSLNHYHKIKYFQFLLKYFPKSSHDDVIKWKNFPRYWPFVRGIHRSPVNSQNKGQWRGSWCLLWSAPE